jgi:hypothetical protein
MIANLSPRSTYYVRLVANDAQGTTYGAGATFSTGDGQQPLVSVASASGVSAHGATLQGTVSSDSSAGSFKFEYGPAHSKYSLSTPEVHFGVSRSTLNAVFFIAGLSAGTTYYFRLVANTAFGTTYGTGAILTTTISAAFSPTI